MRRRLAVLILPVVVLAAACGSSGSTTSSPTLASPESSATSVAPTSATSTPQAPMPGPEVPAASSIAAAVPVADLPTVSGAAGEKPTLTFPSTPPPPSLQRQILTEGGGPEVVADQKLVVNYLGQVWGGEVFDNSWDKGGPVAFSIAPGSVVSGWTVGLQGVKVGSRVLLSLPPADGYGINGNAGAGIKGTDTIVFVVDVKAAVNADQGGQTDIELMASPSTMLKVTGALGSKPTIAYDPNMLIPEQSQVAVLAQGTGAAIAAGDHILVQYDGVSMTDGQSVGSTWPDPANPQGGGGPELLPVTAGSVFDTLVGIPVGSRVEMVIPGSQGSSGSSQPAMTLVLDIVAKVS